MNNAYKSNTEPEIGDKVTDSDGNLHIVETVSIGRVGNIVGARNISTRKYRELYYYCWQKVN